MKNIKTLFSILLMMLCLASCKEEEVLFSDEADFSSIQIQKFDYGSRSGRGQIYQGAYSVNKDTIYFDVTYFPDQEAPTYSDWQIQATLPSGALVSPGLAGVRDLSEPLMVSVAAPDGHTFTDYVLRLRIYEVPFGELEKGFGRYSQLFELTKDQLGGWSADAQRACAVVGDELIVSNMNNPFLVYNKLTGAKIERNIPMPAGETFYDLCTDKDGLLIAPTFVTFSASTTPVLKVYRWVNGIGQAPELFYELPTSKIPATGNHGIGLRISVCGSTQGDAQMMFDIDGRGSSDDRAVRVSVVNGVPSADVDVFSTGVGTVWSGKAIAMSETQRTPYVAAMLGFPPKIGYSGANGSKLFVVDTNNSNFLNKIIGNATYFEFNHSKYLALSTINWPGNYRLLIFCLDDPSLIEVGKDEPDKFALLNPFVAEPGFTSSGDAGSIAVQVSQDGKTAWLYMLGMNTGILAYEFSIIGSSSN